MSEDNIISFKNPADTQDLLTEIARRGAREMLAKAIELEVQDFLGDVESLTTEDGRKRIVRNGYLPEREVQTGIGPLAVHVPRVRDRASSGSKIDFSSAIIPRYLRRSKSIETLLPLLYLKGISTGDFKSALSPILGEAAKNLSPGVISRLKSAWEGEYGNWQHRDLSLRNYVYWWADGIYLKARMEDAKDCVLVVIGVDEYGKKELLAIEDGYRESKESWKSLIRSLKERGLSRPPKVAVGDGALGFWSAISEEFPSTDHQRCWVHKTCNVLDKMPKSIHSKAKSALHEIWMSETKADAKKAFEGFIKTYGAKYPKAIQCLEKDKEELLTFYEYPAEHWKSLRTTNPIESTFATVRHRTKKVKGCFSRKTILTMVFKLCESAEKRWHRIAGFKRLGEVITGVKFVDGVASINHDQDMRDAA
jgi:putative transposase